MPMIRHPYHFGPGHGPFQDQGYKIGHIVPKRRANWLGRIVDALAGKPKQTKPEQQK